MIPFLNSKGHSKMIPELVISGVVFVVGIPNHVDS